MHIFFSGIGGMGIGPLALIAKQAGYEISGSDKQDSQYIEYLKAQGVNNIHTGQTSKQIAAIHKHTPIDWYVYSSAIEKENPNHPELIFARDHNIKMSKRDELINQIVRDKNIKMVAIAGTHGKTTTTAMVIWLFKQLGLPVSYSVGAKIPFGEMGHYQDGSEYFVYEADEFDRNFLAFKPYLSLISGVSWDHHEIFPTREDYQQAFRQFIGQSEWTILWKRETDYLGAMPNDNISVLDADELGIDKLRLAGRYNREDAWLAIQGVTELTYESYDKLSGLMNNFPGLHRRMEEIVPGLYSDEAHTPDKIRGAMSAALEIAQQKGNKKIVVVYEPLTNRRMHYLAKDHHSVFEGAAELYWVPSYLAREDPAQEILLPQELIKNLSPGLQKIAHAAKLDDELKHFIQGHLHEGHMVVAMSGGGGGSLDEWIRKGFG